MSVDSRRITPVLTLLCRPRDALEPTGFADADVANMLDTATDGMRTAYRRKVGAEPSIIRSGASDLKERAKSFERPEVFRDDETFRVSNHE